MVKIVPRDNPCYCIKLRRAANTLTKFYDQAFITLDLTTNQFSLLNDIHLLKSCNKSELAQYARLDRTTIIRNLNTLHRKKLIKEVSVMNNRNKVIQLTEIGESIRIRGLEIWKTIQKKVKLVIGEENKDILNQILNNIELLEEKEG